jgi:NAD(P)-dependent dehydrogenase (short-subunit alcohol dehydrogenase family)
MSARFAGKVAIVTGAGNGIGLAIAHGFAGEGAIAVVADISEAAGMRAVDDIIGAGGKASFVAVDVSDEAQVEGMVREIVARHGAIDILVNNAGIVLHKLIVDMPRAEWDRQIDVQLTGPFLCAKHVARHMIARGEGGRMVNISSLSGTMGRVRGAAHCVSKAGVNLLTKVLAMELAPHRINVNTIAPGLIDVPAQRDEATLSLAYRQSYVRMIPWGRMGETHEIARAVMFLCSEDANWITGEHMVVDGGTMAGHYALGEQHDFAGPDGHT